MGDRRWTGAGRIVMLGAVGLALSACGVEPTPAAEPAPLEAVELPPVAEPPAPVIERAPLEVVARSEQQNLDQPAIWPAADVVFDTPEEAAADFVTAVLISDGDAALGEFQQGDARSGEIAVLFAGETGDLDTPVERGVLFLRQIAPTDGWYVIAAASDGVVIDSPSALDEVPAGAITVSGEGRGFEGTLVATAFSPGDDDAGFDLQIGAGGAFDELAPYSIQLDLSGAAAGDTVAILVRGDTGLSNDPSTFAAIPVVITSSPSATIPATIPPTR
jgi:hypothetical protein